MDQLGDTIVNGVFRYTASMIKDWVNMGIRVIIGRVPTRKCEQLFSTVPSKFAPTTGLALETQKLISVLRDDDDNIPRMCDKIPYEKSSQLNDVNSLYAPSKLLPKYVLEPQTDSTILIKVYPVSGSSIATANMVSYIEVDPAFLSILAGFPEELEPYVDLYAVIQGKIRAMGYYRKLINDQINLINGTFVVSTNAFVAQTELNYNHNNGSQPDILIIDSNGNELEADVDHTTAGGTPSVNDVRIRFTFAKTGTVIISGYSTSSGLTDLFISSLPTWNDIYMGTTVTSGSLVVGTKYTIKTFATSDDFTNVGASSNASGIEFIATGTTPTTWTNGSAIVIGIPVVPTLEADASSPTSALPTPPTIVSDISVYIAANPLPTSPTLEADASNVSALIGAIPTFDGTTTVTLADISVTRIVNALNQAGDLIWKAPDDTENDLANDVEHFLTENDSEMAREASVGANSQVGIAKGEIETELAKLGNWDKEYNAKVRNFVAQVNAWVQEWKTYTDEDSLKLQQYLEDLKVWVETWKAYTDEDNIAIKKYSADLDVWLAQWKSFVEEDTLKISLWREQVAQIVSVYGADITNESTRFSSLLAKSKAYLEASLIRLRTADNYIASAGAFPAEITLLQKQFDEGILHFIRN